MLDDYQIIPAFPSVIGATHIKEDISKIWNDVDNIKFSPNDSADSLGYVSEKMRLLNDYPEIKHILLNEFYNFKNNCLQLTTTEFNMTTSWMTKTPPNGFCQHHHHKNSYYSAVLYQKPSNDENSGNLVFVRPTLSTFLPNNPVEYNIFNSDVITIEPDTNLIIFFPSHLYHRITKYTGDDNRYSIAFNLFPVGTLKHGDSSVELEAS